MVKNYTKLYANGCSHTNHSGVIGLDACWPALLGKMLNLPVINDAQGNGSNHRIFRTSQTYLEQNSNDLENTLAIIQLTQPFRFEYFIDDNGWVPAKPVVMDDHTRHKLQWWNQTNSVYEFYLQANAINNLFNSYNVDTYFIVYNFNEVVGDFPISNHTVNWLVDSCPSKSSIVRLGGFEHMHEDLYHSTYAVSVEDGHLNLAGNTLVAEEIFKYLNRRSK